MFQRVFAHVEGNWPSTVLIPGACTIPIVCVLGIN